MGLWRPEDRGERRASLQNKPMYDLIGVAKNKRPRSPEAFAAMLNEFLALRVFYGFLPSNPQEGCHPIEAQPATLGAQQPWIVHCSSAVAPFVSLP